MTNVVNLFAGDAKAASVIDELKRVIYNHYTGGSVISALGCLRAAEIEIMREQDND